MTYTITYRGKEPQYENFRSFFCSKTREIDLDITNPAILALMLIGSFYTQQEIKELDIYDIILEIRNVFCDNEKAFLQALELIGEWIENICFGGES